MKKTIMVSALILLFAGGVFAKQVKKTGLDVIVSAIKAQKINVLLSYTGKVTLGSNIMSDHKDKFSKKKVKQIFTEMFQAINERKKEGGASSINISKDASTNEVTVEILYGSSYTLTFKKNPGKKKSGMKIILSEIYQYEQGSKGK